MPMLIRLHTLRGDEPRRGPRDRGHAADAPPAGVLRACDDHCVRPNAPHKRTLLLGGLLLLASACGGGADSAVAPPAPPAPAPPPPPTASFAGVVADGERDGVPVAGAQVTLAGLSAATGADGRFAFPTVPTGAQRLTITAPGFDAFAGDISVQAGNSFRSFLLVPVNTFHESGNTLVYLPPGVATFRGAFVVLHGGTSDSRPLLRGELDFYQNLPPSGDVAGYRVALRAFAREKAFAVVGMKTPALAETGASVAADIVQGLLDASGPSEHPELADAALVLQGMSNGACAVNKVVQAIPDRIIGFISMKAPAGCGFATSSPVGSVPGYFFIGELDGPEINAAVTRDFDQSRGDGAVWGFAIERGAGHTWVRDHPLIFTWAGVVAAQRLPTDVTPGGPVALRPVGESAGWLGDRTALSIAAYACFAGNKLTASWLPSERTARDWQAMMGSVTTVQLCQ